MKRAAMVALLALASSLAHAQGIDVEATKRALRIADLELAKAVADRSLQTFVSLVDDDAVFFGKDVARGKNAVSKAWLPFFTDRALFLKWYPTQAEIAASGDLGYTIGEYERIGKDAGRIHQHVRLLVLEDVRRFVPGVLDLRLAFQINAAKGAESAPFSFWAT